MSRHTHAATILFLSYLAPSSFMKASLGPVTEPLEPLKRILVSQDQKLFSMSHYHEASRKLRTACERAKRMLSSSTGATIEAFVGDHEINMPYTRARFDKICEPLFQRCVDSVKRVLDDAKKKKEQVDEIVLVGGGGLPIYLPF
jgi:hypothetical protein